MSTIRRQPPAHESAMWPDTLPASMVVPAGFTLYPPANLDLSETDLTVNGAVVMPVSAASEVGAGPVELATIAEATAGTDTERAVTPAGVASAIAALGDVDFDEVTFFNCGTGSGAGINIRITLLKNGEPLPLGTYRRVTVLLGYGRQGSGMECAARSGGGELENCGYQPAHAFVLIGYFSGTNGTDIAGFWGWSYDGLLYAKVYENPNPYSSLTFTLVVIRSDGAEFESGTLTLPQGQ